MHIRQAFVLSAAILAWNASTTEAVSITSSASNGYYVSATAPTGGTGGSRFAPVSGNGNTSKYYTILEFDATSIKNSLLAGGGSSVESIGGLTLKLCDTGVAGVAGAEISGSLNFLLVDTSVPVLLSPTNTPKFDTTQVGGITNELGATTSLGSATYTATNTTPPPNPVPDGYFPIINYSLTVPQILIDDINNGTNFRILITPGTASTKANFGNWFGLSSSGIMPASLDISNAVVPEPGTLSLAAIGLAGLLRRKH